MLKNAIIAATTAVAIAGGATALQSTPAEAGITINLVHGKSYGWGHRDIYRHRYTPRRGFNRFYRPRCVTTYKKVKFRKWHNNRHRWVVRTMKQPVTVCR